MDRLFYKHKRHVTTVEFVAFINGTTHVRLPGGINTVLQMNEAEFLVNFQPYNIVLVEESNVVDDCELELVFRESIPVGFSTEGMLTEPTTLRVPLADIVSTFRKRE